MFKNYRALWLLLAVGMAIFVAIEFLGPVRIGDNELKTSKFVQTLSAQTPATGVKDSGSTTASAATTAQASPTEDSAGSASTADVAVRPVTDTVPKTILFIGDSMLEGLSPRLAAYAAANGHTLYTVIWYSSTSEYWGSSNKLRGYISRLKPDFIFICLGANELFVRDIAEKRDKYVKNIVRDIGDIPYVWIGPPNWKADTGINDLIAANTAPGTFFVSNGMHFDRAKDGAHPTRSSAVLWMDSVARWMPLHGAHPIRMDRPDKTTGHPKRIFVHQPNER